MQPPIATLKTFANEKKMYRHHCRVSKKKYTSHHPAYYLRFGHFFSIFQVTGALSPDFIFIRT